MHHGCDLSPSGYPGRYPVRAKDQQESGQHVRSEVRTYATPHAEHSRISSGRVVWL